MTVLGDLFNLQRLFRADLVSEDAHHLVVVAFGAEKGDGGQIIALALHQVVDVAVTHYLVEVFVLDSSQNVS